MDYYNTDVGFVVKREKEINLFENMDKIYDNELMSNEWPSSSDDFLESIFSSDLLKELDGTNLDLNGFPEIQEHERESPVSSSEKDFVGFQEMTFNDINLNFPEQLPMMSSNSSDSGLSSDHMDIDTSPDYEPLSPALSSPGPSISERGGQNSPPHHYIQQQKSIKISTPKYQNVGHQLPPKVIVEKINSDGNLLFNNEFIGTGNGLTKEVKIYRMQSPASSTTSSISSGQIDPSIGRKVTIQLKQSGGKNNKNAVIVNKQGVPISGVRKLIRVQNPSSATSRSILLPIHDVKDLRTIKIINSSNFKTKPNNIKLAAANLLQQSKQGLVQKNVLISKDQLMSATDDSFSDHTSDGEGFVFEEVMQQTNNVIAAAEATKSTFSNDDEYDDNDDDDDDDDISTTEECNSNNKRNNAGGYPKLILNAEEKRLLSKEGISLPSSYPLTKHEERELKRIRRKIRNKISAQDSRKRKKEYVDGLEERVKQCTEENQTLLKRIKLLQTQNHNLMSQMKKLQSLITKGTGKTAQPATCLMVLLLSMALVAVPNLKLGQNTKESEIADAIRDTLTQNQQSRRSLLFDTKDQLGDVIADEEINFDELMSFSGLNENVDFVDEIIDDDLTSAVMPAKKQRMLVDFDIDDKVWSSESPLLSDSNSKFNEHASIYQENIKNLQSSGFNIGDTLIDVKLEDPMGHHFDADIMELLNKNAGGDYELNIDKIVALQQLASDDNHRLDGGNSINHKKNSSAQIKTRNMIQVQDV